MFRNGVESSHCTGTGSKRDGQRGGSCRTLIWWLPGHDWSYVTTTWASQTGMARRVTFRLPEAGIATAGSPDLENEVR